MNPHTIIKELRFSETESYEFLTALAYYASNNPMDEFEAIHGDELLSKFNLLLKALDADIPNKDEILNAVELFNNKKVELMRLLGNTGQTDHPFPEQIDHPFVWRKSDQIVWRSIAVHS